MKLKTKYTLDDLKQILFVFMFAFPIWPLKITNLLFISFSICVLICYFKEKPSFEFKKFKFYLLFTLPFIAYFIELMIYPHSPAMQFEAEKKLLFLFAPLIFYLNSCLHVKTEIKHVLSVFVISISTLSFFALAYLCFKLSLFSVENYSNGAFIIRKCFEDFSGLHPVYYGLFSSVASLWLVFYFKDIHKKYQFLMAILLFVMLILNFILAAKMPLFIFVIGLLWIVYKKVPDKKRLVMYYFFGLIALVGIAIIIPSLRVRIVEAVAYFNKPEINNTVLERYVIFQSSKFMFMEHFFTGVGARNAQDALDYGYYWSRFGKGFENHFNSHNQYLTLGLCYGIGILLLFLFLLVTLFKKLWHHAFGIIFCISTVLIMLTESILERQMGIYYFLFFGLLFLFPIIIKNTTKPSINNAK